MEDIKNIIARIKENDPSFTMLDLRGFQNSDVEGYQAVFEALKTNSFIVEVDLSSVNIGWMGRENMDPSKAVIATAETLKINASIKRINLWGNNLHGNQLQPIMKALKANTSIAEVNLGGNFLGNKDIKAIAEMLEKNTSIRKIGLMGNIIISPEGFKFLAEALKTNTIITEIDLSATQLDSSYPAGDKDTKEAIDSILKRNQEIATTTVAATSAAGPRNAIIFGQEHQTNESESGQELVSRIIHPICCTIL